MSDFAPTASWERLRLRAELLRRVRRFFDDRGFLEVETPLLSVDTVVDRHLDPLGVTLPLDPRLPAVGTQFYLQTSPEFAMKRLLAAGGRAIYQITRAFRAGEQGRLHNPEFTMLEWYRCGDGLQAAMDLLAELAETMLSLSATERLTYQEAFRRSVGLDPLQSDSRQLRDAVARQGIVPPGSMSADDRDGWLDLLLTECVEPRLGQGRATILYHYPASQAALARLSPEDCRVAERFELYVQGVELANGYHELTDPSVLRQRSAANNTARIRDGKQALPEKSRLLEAMEHGLPPSSGVALGFDRLVMLAVGAASLAEVMPFPIDRA